MPCTLFLYDQVGMELSQCFPVSPVALCLFLTTENTEVRAVTYVFSCIRDYNPRSF